MGPSLPQAASVSTNSSVATIDNKTAKAYVRAFPIGFVPSLNAGWRHAGCDGILDLQGIRWEGVTERP